MQCKRLLRKLPIPELKLINSGHPAVPGKALREAWELVEGSGRTESFVLASR